MLDDEFVADEVFIDVPNVLDGHRSRILGNQQFDGALRSRARLLSWGWGKALSDDAAGALVD